MIERLLGSSWVYVVIAVAGFAVGAATGGWSVYQMWSVDSLQSDLASAKKDVETEKAEKALVAAALEAQKRATAKANQIAADNAAEAEALEAAKAEKETELARFAEELAAERAEAPPACVCRLTERERQRLYDRFPVQAPAAPDRLGSAAAPGERGVPVPRSGDRP